MMNVENWIYFRDSAKEQLKRFRTDLVCPILEHRQKDIMRCIEIEKKILMQAEYELEKLGNN